VSIKYILRDFCSGASLMSKEEPHYFQIKNVGIQFNNIIGIINYELVT